MPSKASAKKSGWLVVAARIPPDMKDKLQQKFPEHKLTDIIYTLINKCTKGHFLGLKIEKVQ